MVALWCAGTLSVEAIYQDRDQFAQLVREVAAPDVGRMGIEVLSFTIKDVYDNVEYLQSLGRAQTANVKRDADIGVAEANRDAGIRVREKFGNSSFKKPCLTYPRRSTNLQYRSIPYFGRVRVNVDSNLRILC